jgi:hypothetical protein
MPDWSGNGNSGTPTNMEDADFVTDTPGGTSCYSARLGGSDEYILIGDVAELKFAHTDDFSVSCWFKTTSTAAATLFSKRDGGFPPDPGFDCLLSPIFSNLRPRFELEDISGNLIAKAPTGPDLADDAWHHVVYVWNGSAGVTHASASLYIDGTLASAIGTGTLTATIDVTDGAQIGARGGTSTPFDGYMDDVTVYNSALSLAEVQEVYNSGFPTDNRTLTAQPNIVGYWGMGEISAGGISKFVSELDGVDEYVVMSDVLDFNHNDPFSVSCWFKTTDNNGYLVSKIDGTPRGWGSHIDASGSFQFVLLTNGTTGVQVATAATGFNDGSWHNAIMTYDGSGLASGVTLYVDSVIETKAAPIFDNLASGTTTNAQALQVNGRTGANVMITTTISDVSIYDVELASAEVSAIYNNGSPTDNTLLDTEPSLIGYWLMGPDANDGAMTNMASGDIVEPGANIGSETASMDISDFPNGAGSEIEIQTSFPIGWVNNPTTVAVGGIGGEEGDTIIVLPGSTFVMRGIDLGGPYPSYHVWTVADSPDDDGSEAGVLPFGGPLDEITVIGIIS